MKVALALRRIGLNSSLMHSLGLGSIVAALSLWARSAAVSDEDRKARAERLAIFVGLWPPTFVLLGKVLQDMEATPEEQVVRALEPEREGEGVDGSAEVKGWFSRACPGTASAN
jgi:hypothetical protein